MGEAHPSYASTLGALAGVLRKKAGAAIGFPCQYRPPRTISPARSPIAGAR